VAIAVPNFSEGRDAEATDAIAAAFSPGVELIDRHSDAAHNRTVLTIVGGPDSMRQALISGARACIERIDMTVHEGEHPCIGALDVCPLVWLRRESRDAAAELALEVAIAIGDLGVPVFLYGELASDERRRERSFARQGGMATLAERMQSGELKPDFGPTAPHPTAGATLVTARPPLAAFNIELDTADVEIARAIASQLRESGGGLGGVRAIGTDLGERAQVSTNIHDPVAVPLGAVIEEIRALAALHGTRPVAGEVVGLVPAAALRELPEDVPLRGFDPALHVIENRLGRVGG
jgi:glutamate formiminotransferase / 5-formyltetrahydrofolate cyclo-ligase